MQLEHLPLSVVLIVYFLKLYLFVVHSVRDNMEQSSVLFDTLSFSKTHLVACVLTAAVSLVVKPFLHFQ